MTVKAWLNGDRFDLETLAYLFAVGEVQVIYDDDQNSYFLTAPDIDNPSEDGRFDIPAESLLRRMNGLARIYSPGYRPVKLVAKYTDSNGRDYQFIAPTGIASRAAVGVPTVSTAGDPIPDPPSPWLDRLALADSNDDIAEVLNILGGQSESLGWVDLYKIYEIIRASIKPKKIYDLGWADKATDSAFTVSANLPCISGSDARHARLEGSPKHTMTIDQGRAYISDLVAKWMITLAEA
ncbi:Uncharacterised protein [Mycobacteroides abscessus subsp. abscessus]|uniref:hypothetical protein n=1 Tax=Mycobacteroides abscessus TaxID=36809 RepID=UPI00078E9807|nr:hypothetical protein [Mycobacteroides abscessus]AMU69847.1 hypothetical protein A3O05_07150 [Mycobacteroides abscessus]MDM2014278.1 hypothetical protein [Mycobacteroides abscessus]MDM2019919.1 hypothetical protein [Mycobacteroides abscessus]MDM2023565.1 hypothetical protein [Mycobacteroides abscessus]MDM2030008.1 hypothetical protein [Mycobacteroides abscessus]